MVRRSIQRFARRLGYEVQRIRAPVRENDPFLDMKHLYRDTSRLTVFDVGAHHGQTAKSFRQAFPESKIYCFEPFPESYDKLSLGGNGDPQIHCFNFGLSDRTGELSLHSNASSATNSLLSTDAQGSRTWGAGLLETNEVVRAQFKTLDVVLEELSLGHVDILKLDVQGAEYLVMKGATDACRAGKIGAIYSEIITQPTYNSQMRLDEALAVFYDRGFDLRNIYNPIRTPGGALSQIDVLFVRSADVPVVEPR